MIGLYTSRLGCIGSLAVSVVLTVLATLLLRACAG